MSSHQLNPFDDPTHHSHSRARFASPNPEYGYGQPTPSRSYPPHTDGGYHQLGYDDPHDYGDVGSGVRGGVELAGRRMEWAKGEGEEGEELRPLTGG